MVKVQESLRSYRTCPPLHNGDHLDAAEFMRRYKAMEARGEKIRAELVNGIVYFMYPAHFESHGKSDAFLQTCLGYYAIHASHVEHATNATVMLGDKDMPMPDGFLWDTQAKNAWLTDDDYLEGSPELMAETAATSAAYDCREKLEAYLKAGVKEYMIWRTLDEEFDWFFLQEGKYVKAAPDEDGIIRSRFFKGLWLNIPAILRKDKQGVLHTLDEGLAKEGLR